MEETTPTRAALRPCVGYLRTQFWLGLAAGGSVSHTAGVVNALHRLARVEVLSNESLPALLPGVPQHVLPPTSPAWLPDLYREGLYNRPFRAFARERIAARGIDCLYHRHSAFSQHAPRLAQELGLPLVLEWNGSQVWMARHWPVISRFAPKRWHERAWVPAMAALERRLLRAADLVVVAADPLVEQVEACGGRAERCAVIPNGVDTELYGPGLDGRAAREKWGIAEEELVMGFIGTFGPWHGTEVLADAIVALFDRHPDLRDDVRFLLIGDGGLRPAVEARLARSRWRDRVIFTGLLPQADAREHLAACDVFLSPHVPNPDGSRFFGSPTKLFEYMALGRPIVASRLEQIGELLQHGRNAYLVPPDDVPALVDALAEVARVPLLRRSLGAQARRDAVARHTWTTHVERLLEEIARLRAA